MGLREMSSNCHHIDGSVAGNSGPVEVPGVTLGGVPGSTGGAGPFPKVGAVRYIKLGERGKWAGQALRDGILPFGYRAVAHAACARGDWEQVRAQLVAMGRKNRSIGQGVRELKDFYELGEDTLWFTIADGHLVDIRGRSRRRRSAWVRRPAAVSALS